MGSIKKKWGGCFKESFTDADTFVVTCELSSPAAILSPFQSPWISTSVSRPSSSEPPSLSSVDCLMAQFIPSFRTSWLSRTTAIRANPESIKTMKMPYLSVIKLMNHVFSGEEISRRGSYADWLAIPGVLLIRHGHLLSLSIFRKGAAFLPSRTDVSQFRLPVLAWSLHQSEKGPRLADDSREPHLLHSGRPPRCGGDRRGCRRPGQMPPTAPIWATVMGFPPTRSGIQ